MGKMSEREEIERNYFLQLCCDRVITHLSIHRAIVADCSTLERDLYLWKWQSAPRAVMIDQDIANIIHGTK